MSRPCPDPQSEGHRPRPELQRIGRSGKPIRALAFAGGGFDTAMQLGVVHALLVCRGRAPDIVIGCSTGAVNAVALAEVFQAGDMAKRVARFRQIYDQYLRAPGLIAAASLPDTFQVDTQRPLQPLKLPIHHRLERDRRLAAVASRAGVINLYNVLLKVRLSIGTVTKAVRRWLGIRGAGNIQQPVLRAFVQAGEVLRSWTLLGANISRVSHLVPLLIEAAARSKPKAEHGATAGTLIFRSRLWAEVLRLLRDGLGLLVIATLWLFLSILVPVLAGIVPVLLWELIPGGLHLHFGGWTIPVALAVGTGILAIVFGVVAGLPEDDPPKGWEEKVSYGTRLALRTIPRALWAAFIHLLLLLRWALAVVFVVGVPVLVGSAVAAERPLSAKAFLAALPLSGAIAGSIVIVVVVLVAWVVYRGWSSIPVSLLARFNLDRALLDPHPVRELLVNLFDPSYYGDLKVDQVVESALRNDNQPTDGPRSEKYLEDYADKTKSPPIHVLVTVADAATADIDVLPGTHRVVDGLVAALAAPPLFPPVSNGRRLYVDGAVVANDPSRPLFRFLRQSAGTLVTPDAAVLHLYTVSPLPFSRPILGAEPDPAHPERTREYTDLVEVVRRALALQRFRDARLERMLTELHTKAMPAAGTLFYPPTPRDGQRQLVRTWVYPIEPEGPLVINARVLGAESETRRRELIAETVADGCRSALSVMMRPAVSATASKPQPGMGDQRTVLCRVALDKHLTTHDVPRPGPLPGSAKQQGDNGPGLAEVCAHCALFRSRPPSPCASRRTPSTSRSEELSRSLLWHPQLDETRPWPLEDAPSEEPDWKDRSRVERVQSSNQEAFDSAAWPRPREIDGARVKSESRSTVSFLFSGGVFRGVFQVGVLNGLSEAGLAPDVVAGASVGSITAAMAVSTFFGNSTAQAATPLAGRRKAIQRLAAAYLAIDRLVLTDRFADFVRGVTVRAAQARFSIQQADRVIRRFDAGSPWRFNRDLREVVAGIERLAYVSPFELLELVEAFRRQQNDCVVELLQQDLQEILNRAGVGTEILGAEPLALLVREYVLEAVARNGLMPVGIRFDAFLDRGLAFLATATNITEGRLEVLGEEQLFAPGGSRLNLLPSLLASSAFPAVFRPRRQWEIWSEGGLWHQYIDGGVMDNLPLDAVAQFLLTAAQSRLIPYRPPVPHLVFSASLETETRAVTDDVELDQLRHNWPRLFRRARRLGYNKKLEMFARTQRNLRAIMTERARAGEVPKPGEWTPLDLWVSTVIPKWLCGTFAFHPMLGFRQWKQAASIAHGCASTLLELGKEVARTGGSARAKVWGIQEGAVPSAAQCANGERDPFVPLEPPSAPGNCWYRPSVPCPFSKAAQQAEGGGPTRITAAALTEIYHSCGRLKTHQPI